MPPQTPAHFLAAKKRMKRGLHDRLIQAREKSFSSIDPNTPRVQRRTSQTGGTRAPDNYRMTDPAPGTRPKTGGTQAPVTVRKHTRAPVGFGRPRNVAKRTLGDGVAQRNNILRGLAAGAAKVGSDNPAALYGAIAKARKRRKV